MAALALLLAAAPAAARQDYDPSASHVPVSRPPDVDTTRLFAERIQQTQLRTGFESLLKQFGGGGLGGDPKERLQKLLQDNPQLQDMIRGMMANPQMRERLEGMVGDMLKGRPELQAMGIQPADIVKRLERLPQMQPSDAAQPPEARPGVAGRGRPSESARPPAERPPAEPQPVDPAEQESRRAWAQNIGEWAKRFPQNKLPGSLRDSPAVKNLMNNLTEATANALQRGGVGEGLDAQLARWESRFRAVRDWLPQHWPEGLASRLPNLSGLARPNVRLPNVNVEGALPNLSAPRLGAPGAADVGNLLTVALVVAAVVMVGLVVWRLRAAQQEAAAAARHGLGPWPFDPAQVSTREELIRAFEYLSLLRLGEPARTWHHRAIAQRLGGDEDERREAAARLAALYEQARYAPDAAAARRDWSDARRPLTLLSGAGAV